MAALKQRTTTVSARSDKSSRDFPNECYTRVLLDPVLDDLTTIASSPSAALSAYTRVLGQPVSEDALYSGLPKPTSSTDPLSLAARAAKRAGFEPTIYTQKFEALTNQDCPCILALNDDRALLIIQVTDDTLIYPSGLQAQPTAIDKALVQDHYACVLLKLKARAPDDSVQQRFNAHWFWSVIRQSKGLYAEVFIASILVNVFALATPLFVMNVYDRVVPNQATNTLWVLASGVALVFIFDFVMKSLRGYFLDVAGKRSDLLLSSATFEQVLNMTMQEHPKRVGSFANQLQEFDQFREFFTSTTLLTLIDLPFVLLFIGLIFGIAGPIGMIPLFALPIVFLISYAAQRQLRPIIQDIFTESSRKTAMLVETLHSLEVIKALQAESTMQARWEQSQDQLASLGLKSRLGSLTTLNLIQLISQSTTVVLVIAGVYAIQAGELSIGGLIACTILTGRALAPMSQIATIMTRYQHALAAYGTIDRLMNLPGERDFKHQFLHRADLKPAVEFRSVSFTYPGQAVPALNSVSFQIKPNEKVAIIGPTGSGKSTIERLISKLYLPANGSLLIDNTDIRQLDPADLRRKMSYLPQESTLLAGSVRDNIRFGLANATDEQILDAANFGGIRTYFDQHPEGFDFQVGERGSFLSGGQRQGIAIARALINNAPLMLLDEPTNAMDRQAEQDFMQQLRQYGPNRTLILITHRMNLLELVDRVIVMRNGAVVADGRKETILSQLAQNSGQPT